MCSLRKCKHCSIEANIQEELSLFVSDKKSKHGRENVCKDCRKESLSDRPISKSTYQGSLYFRDYYSKNKEKYKKSALKWQSNNADIISEKQHIRYIENRDARLQQSKEWIEENRGKSRAYKAKNQAKRNLRVPSWLTPDDFWMMGIAYETARERTEQYGVEFEVDHIIPLNGKYVSGLHVPDNLQVITRYDNNRKSNHFAI